MPSTGQARLDMIAREVLFLLSALGAINGIFLAVYFFSRRAGRLADRMLGGLLLAVSVRTAKSTILFFHPAIALEFRQLGLSACLLIGPLTYLYICSHLADIARRPIGSQWRWHLGLCALLIASGIAFPYAAYREVWDKSSYGIHAFWLCYLLVAGRALWQARHTLGGSAHSLLPWSVFVGSCVILAAYASTPFTSYIVGALSLTFTIHITILIFLLRRESLPAPSVKEKYRNNRLSHDEAMTVLASIEQLMRAEKLYLNPNLNLGQLARKAGLAQAVVSQVLNDKLDKSFNAYVNEYRIAQAKDLLAGEPQLTLEIVAERSGFNSNSTFFAAFKKIAGQTPASFRARSSQPIAGGSA
jgi:AraC-like DNA-binding protein